MTELTDYSIEYLFNQSSPGEHLDCFQSLVITNNATINTPYAPFILKTEWQPTQVFLSGKPMDKGAWRVTVHGVTKSQTQLID